MHAKTNDHPADVRALTPTGHLVLGMVALFGPMTSYQLEQRVGATIASFWLFPHSQLYAEPRKLSDAGLLQETVEQGGRKRRTYELTSAGEAALGQWFAEPEGGRAEARDPGLLKLFFADLAGPEDVRQLAESQAKTHRSRALELQTRRRQLSSRAGRHLLATLELGIRHAITFAEFWEQLAAEPDGTEADASQRDGADADTATPLGPDPDTSAPLQPDGAGAVGSGPHDYGARTSSGAGAGVSCA